jgi:hypothetical protein
VPCSTVLLTIPLIETLSRLPSVVASEADTATLKPDRCRNKRMWRSGEISRAWTRLCPLSYTTTRPFSSTTWMTDHTMTSADAETDLERLFEKLLSDGPSSHAEGALDTAETLDLDFPTAVEYGADAILYLAQHAEELLLGPERFAVSGFSSGGNMSFTVPLDGLDVLSFDVPSPTAPSSVFPVVSGTESVETKSFNGSVLPIISWLE